jgi:hypothetical protein
MTLPSSGTITMAMVATEIGISLPLEMTDSRIRTLTGKASGSIVMPTDFYGKSWFTVDFTVGAEQDVTSGSPVSGNRRIYRLLSSSIVGGSGSYTYAWAQSGAVYSSFWLNQTSNPTAQFSQGYNTNDFEGPYGDSATITLTVTDTGTGLVKSASHTVYLG